MHLQGRHFSDNIERSLISKYRYLLVTAEHSDVFVFVLCRIHVAPIPLQSVCVWLSYEGMIMSQEGI